MAYLRDWQTHQLTGDSLLNDYHLMWNQYKDPGYHHLCRILYEDMHNLVKLGLNGNLSCEIPTCQIPHDFPHRILARTLWSRDIDYYAQQQEYFSQAYGEDFGLVLEYLDRISKAFSVIYRYYTDPENSRDEQKALGATVEDIVFRFKPVIHANLAKALPRAQHLSWELLDIHGKYLLPFANAYCAKYMGDTAASERYLEQFNAVCDEIHEKYDPYFSIFFCKFSVKYYCDEITEHGANVVLQ